MSAVEAGRASEDGENESGDQITMRGIDLRLYDIRPTFGRFGKPTFRVQAKTGSLKDEGMWVFEGAEAVIYGRDEGDEDVTLEAARGRFHQDEGASLAGGITARVGAMVLELEDMVWINADREARTDKPVRIVDGATRLRGGTLRLYPDKRMFVLTDAKGVIRFDKEES